MLISVNFSAAQTFVSPYYVITEQREYITAMTSSHYQARPEPMDNDRQL